MMLDYTSVEEISQLFNGPMQGCWKVIPERTVTLFVDSGRAHKAKAVHRLLEKHHHQIQVEWLPAYAPELNLQEDV